MKNGNPWTHWAVLLLRSTEVSQDRNTLMKKIPEVFDNDFFLKSMNSGEDRN